MAEQAEKLSLTDIANRAGVQLSAVSNWRKRHDDFPTASAVAGQEEFDLHAVAEWLRGRKIPQNRLKSDEPPGISYGERFLKNSGIENLSAELPTRHETAPPKADWRTSLWRAMDRLRGTRSAAASLELLLDLVYVRVRRPDIWDGLLDASRWPQALHALPQVEIPVADASTIQILKDLKDDPDRLLFETVRILDAVDFGDGRGPNSTGAQISEAILAELERGMGRSGGQFTPPSVARCLVELLDPRPSDRIYDPFCGSGELLSTASAYVSRQKNPPADWQVYGQTSHEWSLRTSTINLALHGTKADLRKGGVLDEDRFPNQRFSRIVANPPFNLSVDIPRDHPWLFGEPPAHNANFAWLDHAVSKLTADGRAAVVMAGGAAFRQSKGELAIRAAMVEAGVVECVIALPSNLFRFTGIPVMVWILRSVASAPLRNETLFIDASRLGKLADRKQRQLGEDEIAQIANEYRRWLACDLGGMFSEVKGFSRAVSHTEIERNDFSLLPGRYTTVDAEELDLISTSAHLLASRAELERLRPRASDADVGLDVQLGDLLAQRPPDSDRPPTPLGSVCDILTGPGTVPRGDPQKSGTPLVLPRNIKAGSIDSGDLDSVPLTTATGMARYRLNPGDIVSARAGTLGRYGLVRDEQAGWLLGPGCVRFRADHRADPEYLTYYLGSPAAQRWLMDRTSGSVIRHVNSKTLGEMPIWLPDLPAQRAIVETLKAFDTAASLHRRVAATAEGIRDLVAALLLSPQINT
ncbi:N-6 DNA methylase [Kribbella sp. NPDC051718]|uniref:N-6 DNA methylase n=1 Tax=Kribbella sp. NPDC051718 TaxID=3155168 RepID=UPI003413A3D9